MSDNHDQLADEHAQQATSFLEIESQHLPRVDGESVRGRAVEVDRIPASAVPDEYPVTITTDEALALRIEIEASTDHETVCYFAYDQQQTTGRLSRLLALHDIPPHRFGDLYGCSLHLVAEDGYYVPYLPTASPRGSPHAVYGLAGGLVFNFVSVLSLFVMGGTALSPLLVLLWIAVNFVGVPLSTYLDSWYLYTHSDWDGGPLFWTFLALWPGLNVLTTILYLRARSTATAIV